MAPAVAPVRSVDTRGVGRREGPIAASLALGLFLMQFPVPLIAVDARPPVAAEVNLFVFDIPLLIVIALASPALVRRIRERRLPAGAALWGVVAALLAIALAVHPSVAGVQTVLRAFGALGIALAIVELRRGSEHDLVLGALVAATLVQLGLGILQVAKGAPLGLGALGEFADPLVSRHETFAPRGTMYHPYVLTGLAVITAALVASRALRATRPLPWIVALALTAVPVGITFSRAALAGFVAGLAVLAPAALARRSGHLAILVALAVGAGASALVQYDGWTARIGQTLFTDRPVTSVERSSVIGLGLETVAQAPITGVGPGRYLPALEERTGLSDPASDLRPHSVPLLIAAEAGVVAGLVTVLLLAVLGWRALRDGPAVAMLYLVFVPFLVIDQYPYVLAQGLVLTGVWLGSLDRAHETVEGARRPPW